MKVHHNVAMITYIMLHFVATFESFCLIFHVFICLPFTTFFPPHTVSKPMIVSRSTRFHAPDDDPK